MEVTITTRHLGMIGGPNEKFLPFGNLRTDAIAAVVTESSATYLSATDGTYSLTGRTDIHAAELFGNEAEVERRGRATTARRIRSAAAPATSTEVEPGEGDATLPVSPTDFPADPAAFLAAWERGMESQLVAEKAAAAKMPQDGDPETNGLYDSIEERLAIPPQSTC